MVGVKAVSPRSCARCRRPLSRYNSGDYCGGCAKAGPRDGLAHADSDRVAEMGTRLRAARLRRGMTLEVLAGLAGLSQAYLSMVENGKRKLDRYSMIVALAEALKVPPAELAPGISASPENSAGLRIAHAPSDNAQVDSDREALEMVYAKTSLRQEKREMRDRLRAAGLNYREIVAEFSRVYGLRPRQAWREAYGWSQKEAADRVNAYRGNTGLDPSGLSGMTGPHLCEYENWPGNGEQPTGRKPEPYLLAVLSEIYCCHVTELLDHADRAHLPAADLLVLDAYSARSAVVGQTFESRQGSLSVHDDEARAIAGARVPNLILRRIREEERRETRSEFAEAMARTALEIGESAHPSERYVARLEDGDIRYPHPAYRRVLVALCGRPMIELGFTRGRNHEYHQNDSGEERDRLSSAPSQDIPVAPSGDREEEIEMERRNLLQSLGVLGIASAPTIGALDHIRRSFGTAYGESDRDHLDDWENAVTEYGYSYLTISPAALVADLATDIVALRSIAASLPKDSRTYRRWCRIGGALSCLMAKSFSNLGDIRESRHWWDMAEHVSDSSGDLELSLWVRGERVLHGLYEQRPAQVLLRQVNSATEFAHGHTRCAGFAHVTTARAQALVVAGDYESAENELRKASDIFAQLPPSVTQDTSSVMGWGQDRLHYTETWVYAHTGNWAKAAQAAEHALRLYPVSDDRTPTQIKLMLAFSLIRHGDINEGLRQALAVYGNLTREQRTSMVDTLARQVMRSVPAEAQEQPDSLAYRALVTSSTVTSSTGNAIES